MWQTVYGTFLTHVCWTMVQVVQGTHFFTV
jgi:hypothetical protein